MSQLQTAPTPVTKGDAFDALYRWSGRDDTSKLRLDRSFITGLLPRDYLLHALFASRAFKGKGARPFWHNATLLETEQLVVRATGPQLDQTDGDVFACLLSAAVAQQQVAVDINMSLLLKQLGLASSGTNAQIVWDRLDRLTSLCLSLQSPHYYTKGDRLVERLDAVVVDGKPDFRHSICVHLSPAFAPALTQNGVLVNLAERRALRGDAFAAWLHNYFSTHSGRKYVSVANLQLIAGRADQPAKHFAADLRKAAETLESALGWTVKLPLKTKQLDFAGRIEIQRPERAERVEVVAEPKAATAYKPPPPPEKLQKQIDGMARGLKIKQNQLDEANRQQHVKK